MTDIERERNALKATIIRQICYEEARSRYGEDLPRVVVDRLEEELIVVECSPYAELLLLAQTAQHNGRLSKKKEASFRGALGSSFLAYLMGITRVNPLPKPYGHDLPCEFFYGYDGTKEPNITMYVDESVKEFIGEVDHLRLVTEKEIEKMPLEVERKTKKIKEEMAPYFTDSFEDQVIKYGLLHGTGTWNENGKVNLEEGWKKEDLIAYREDVLHSLLHFGVNWAIAFQMAEKTGKGKLTEQDLRDLYAMGVPDEYIQSMKKIHYLFPKAHGIECVRLGLF